MTVVEGTAGSFQGRRVFLLPIISRLCVGVPGVAGFVFKCRDDSPGGKVALLFFLFCLLNENNST